MLNILRTVDRFGKLPGLTAFKFSDNFFGKFSTGRFTRSDSQLSVSCEIISTLACLSYIAQKQLHLFSPISIKPIYFDGLLAS